ncbi:class I adenylate-forming enzyme family protein [Nocardioides insulae]|uniref:class I adenylate-forming enzyme family protein n=1 Tax=Nocardioides insulae TaxID=394734 RepID=UPI0004068C5D|nr:class I adenylate-forming enzyme family protein [Nocardioides insulae]
MTDLVDRHAFDRARRDRTAFRFEGTSLTFGQLHESYRCVATGLRNQGIRRGDRVALYLRNGLEWIESLFAITALGAIAVPVNVLLTGRDVSRILSIVQPTALIADSDTLEALGDIEGVPDITVVVGDRPAQGGVSFDELRQTEAEVPGVEGSPEDPAMIYFTSGTTGVPKGAVHTHHTLCWNTLHQIRDLEVSSDERFLVVPSLTWGAGLHDVTLALTWEGGCNVILPTGGSTLERIVDTVCTERITRTLLVPTLLKELILREDLLERLRTSCLRRVMSGAEPLDLALLERLSEALPDIAITQTYGMTEFPMIATVTTAEDARKHPGKAGRASSIITLGVCTPDGEIRDRGAGEIVFRSPATTIGYYEAAEQTAEAFRDGWFHSGDLGEIDEDGYLTVTGRLKDMIVSGGLNVYPREIESVLAEIPGVAEVAVIGKPDKRWGEVPVAVVTRRQGSALTDTEVLDFCRREFSGFRRPRTAVVRDEPLPRTVTGKIRKLDIEV